MTDTILLQTQTWRDELDAALKAKEEAERQEQEARRRAGLAAHNTQIDALIELYTFLGIEGDVRDVRSDRDPEWRLTPIIVRDGYYFQFQSVNFEVQYVRDGKRLMGHVTPKDTDTKEIVAWFQLSIERRVIEKGECPLRKCYSSHTAEVSIPDNRTGRAFINLTTGEGRDPFRVKLAAALRRVDEIVEDQQKKHAAYVAKRLREDEEEAYEEKARREWAPPEESDEPEEDLNYNGLREEPLRAAPQPRQRVIVEGSWEWKLLEIFDELRNGESYY